MSNADVPLQVRFTFPLTENDCDRSVGPIIFTKWLPLEDSDAISVVDRDIVLRFWIDEDCISRPCDKDNIGNYVNVSIRRIYCVVSGMRGTDELANVVIALAVENDWTDEHLTAAYDPQLLEEYCTFGNKAYLAAVARFNRLISFVRAFKGQYWLKEYQGQGYATSSEFARLRAKVKAGHSDWLSLSMTGELQYSLAMPSRSRFVNSGDWESVTNHVKGERPTPLVGALLAAADDFFEAGQRRAAVTEAVSALEVAVSQFAQFARTEKWRTQLAGRSGAESLQSHVNHLGTTCTINYLLPILFSEEQLPGNLLAQCREAIDIRNAVVHRGQRDVEEPRLRKCLTAIRELCDALRSLRDEGRLQEESA